MAKFEPLDASAVLVGRGRIGAEARQPYMDAIAAGEAGRIDLDKGEKHGTAKRYLSDAAKQLGVRIRSTYDQGQNAIFWKRVQKVESDPQPATTEGSYPAARTADEAVAAAVS